MSDAADLQDRRRAAVAKVRDRMIAMLLADPAFEQLRFVDAKVIADAASSMAWDAVVEVSS